MKNISSKGRTKWALPAALVLSMGVCALGGEAQAKNVSYKVSGIQPTAPGDSSSAAYVLTPGGDLVWTSQRFGMTWIASDVALYEVSRSALYILDNNEVLWRYTHQGAPEKVDESVWQFQFAGTDAATGQDVLFVLGRDKNLWREVGNWQNRGTEPFDRNVFAFSAIDDSNAYVQSFIDKRLWRERGGWQNRTLVMESTSLLDFGAVSSSTVLVLKNGTLTRGTFNATSDRYDFESEPVDRNVAEYEAVPNTNDVYVLGNDANLWLERGNWTNRGTEPVDGNVLMFSGMSSPTAFVLGKDGNVWLERGTWRSRVKIGRIHL